MELKTRFFCANQILQFLVTFASELVKQKFYGLQYKSIRHTDHGQDLVVKDKPIIVDFA